MPLQLLHSDPYSLTHYIMVARKHCMAFSMSAYSWYIVGLIFTQESMSGCIQGRGYWRESNIR